MTVHDMVTAIPTVLAIIAIIISEKVRRENKEIAAKARQNDREIAKRAEAERGYQVGMHLAERIYNVNPKTQTITVSKKLVIRNGSDFPINRVELRLKGNGTATVRHDRGDGVVRFGTDDMYSNNLQTIQAGEELQLDLDLSQDSQHPEIQLCYTTSGKSNRRWRLYPGQNAVLISNVEK